MKARKSGGLSLTSIVALALAANAAVLLALSTGRLFDYRSAFSTAPLLALFWFLLLVLFLLWRTPEAVQPLFAVTAAVLFEAYTVRATVLALAPTLYRHSAITLESRTLTQTVGYMSLGIMAYWAALRCPPIRNRAAAAMETGHPRDASRSPLLRQSGVILVFANLTMLAVTGLNVTQGLSQGSGLVAIGLSAAPIDILLYTVVYLGVCYWKYMAPVKKIATVSYVVLFAVNGLSLGSRGALLAIALAVAIVLLVVRPEMRLRPRWLLAASLLLIAVLVPLLNLTMNLRDDVRSGSAGLVQLLDSGVTLGQDRLGVLGVLEMITNRQAGLDATYVVLKSEASGIDDYVGPLPLMRSILMSLWSDEALGFEAKATGAVFAHFYEGHPFYEENESGTGHYGAFSGFGFAAAYFEGVGGLFFIASLGAAVGLLFAYWSTRSVFEEVVPLYLISKLAFQFFESGNLDLILAGAAKQLLVFSGVLVLVRLTIPRSLARRHGSPERAMSHDSVPSL